MVEAEAGESPLVRRIGTANPLAAPLTTGVSHYTHCVGYLSIQALSYAKQVASDLWQGSSHGALLTRGAPNGSVAGLYGGLTDCQS